MHKLNKAKCQGDLDSSKVVWVAEDKWQKDTVNIKRLTCNEQIILIHAILSVGQGSGSEGQTCTSAVAPRFLCFWSWTFVPVPPVSPINLMVVGCFGQWTYSPLYSLWTSGAARLKPVTLSHIFLPSQVCPQNVAGIVISHAPENRRGLCMH